MTCNCNDTGKVLDRTTLEVRTCPDCWGWSFNLAVERRRREKVERTLKSLERRLKSTIEDLTKTVSEYEDCTPGTEGYEIYRQANIKKSALKKAFYDLFSEENKCDNSSNYLKTSLRENYGEPR